MKLPEAGLNTSVMQEGISAKCQLAVGILASTITKDKKIDGKQ